MEKLLWETIPCDLGLCSMRDVIKILHGVPVFLGLEVRKEAAEKGWQMLGSLVWAWGSSRFACGLLDPLPPVVLFSLSLFSPHAFFSHLPWVSKCWMLVTWWQIKQAWSLLFCSLRLAGGVLNWQRTCSGMSTMRVTLHVIDQDLIMF